MLISLPYAKRQRWKILQSVSCGQHDKAVSVAGFPECSFRYEIVGNNIPHDSLGYIMLNVLTISIPPDRIISSKLVSFLYNKLEYCCGCSHRERKAAAHSKMRGALVSFAASKTKFGFVL